jgi:hypothetical protein
MDRSGQRIYVTEENGTYKWYRKRITPEDMELYIKFSPSGRV